MILDKPFVIWYYSIKRTSAIFLHLLLDGHSKDKSISKIADLFSLNVSDIVSDFDVFLNELVQENIIVEVAAPLEVLNSEWLTTAVTNDAYTKPSIEIHTDMEELVLLY